MKMLEYSASRYDELKEEVETHGLYWSSLNEDERIICDLAQSRGGLDDEISLLKVKIRTISVLFSTQAMGLLVRMLSCLDKLLKTNKAVFKKGEVNHLDQAVKNALKDIIDPEMAQICLDRMTSE
jgi:hypothetical protein